MKSPHSSSRSRLLWGWLPDFNRDGTQTAAHFIDPHKNPNLLAASSVTLRHCYAQPFHSLNTQGFRAVLKMIPINHFGAELGLTRVWFDQVGLRGGESAEGLFVRLIVLFPRLSKAIAFTIHLEDFAMVSQARPGSAC